MARKKFEEGFKENAILYCQTNSDKTIKACAADLGIGYSTLRRWIAQSEEHEVEAATAVEEKASSEIATEENVVAEAAPTEAPEETPVAKEEALTEEKEVEEIASVTEECAQKVAAPEKEEVHEEATELATEAPVEEIVADEPEIEEPVAMMQEAVMDQLAYADEVVSEEPANKLDGVKNQIEGIIESAGDAIQLFGLYKKRHELKKVQKKLQKEKEKRFNK